MMRRFAILPLVFFFFSSPNAATIQVPADQPTIQAGLSAASPGDSVIISCGTYYESELVLIPYIALVGETGASGCVVIDGEQTACLMSAASCGNVLIEGITFRNGGSPSHAFGGGVRFTDTSGLLKNVTFENCYTSTQGGAVFAEGASYVDFHGCTFRYCTSRVGGAFSCSNGYYNFIQCEFYGNYASANGVAIFCPWAPHATIQDCTIVGNSTPGVGVVIHYLGHMENTIVAFNNTDSAIQCNPGTVFQCNDIFGNAGGDWVGSIAGQSGLNGNFSADPLFCDFAADDYTLALDSPCAPGNHPDGYDCGLIGALPVACGPVAVPKASWSAVKSLY